MQTESPKSPPHYRDILREAFQDRRARNPHYSLRAFARDLMLSPSTLSDVLNDKCGLSRASAKQIARALNYNQSETEYLCDLVDSLEARSKSDRDLAKIRLRKYTSRKSFTPQDLDRFHILSEWHHLAICELTLLESFKADPDWIASTLDVPVEQVAAAIERLVRVGLLRQTRRGLNLTDENLVFGESDVPSERIRQFHDQVLEKASMALYRQNVFDRDYSALTVAINTSDLPKLKRLLKKFQRDFSADAAKSDQKNALYMMSQQFFRLDDTRRSTHEY